MVDRSAKGSSPTLETVAQRAGVSRATVSRVINGNRNVDPEIQTVVRMAIDATGYVPNRAARSLVTRRSEAVALVVSGAGTGIPDGIDPPAEPGTVDDVPVPRGTLDNQVLHDPFFGRITAGVIGYLRPRAMYPVLMLADSQEARDQVTLFLRQGHADGAVLVSTHADDPLPEELTDAGVPVALFARPAHPVPASYVDLAHSDGGALAADRLYRQGRRRMVCISGPLDVRAARERLKGFEETLALQDHPRLRHVEGNFTQESGEKAMEYLLAMEPRLDGVFAANDLMAQGALHVLREHGRRVPEDVAVIGFDDSSAATASRPTLTTVRQPIEEMAAEMTRLLVERIETPSLEPTSVIFEPTLVGRQSG